MKIIEKALTLFFPTQCGICGKIGYNICKKCEIKINKYQINLKYRDNKRKINYFYIYKYDGEIRKLLIDYKFNDKSYLVNTLKNLFIKNKKLCRFLKNYDIIIPVPLHKKRKFERGYNQVELIARKLEIIHVNTISLIKIKNIKPQSIKNEKERKQDIKGVFKIVNNNLKNKKVLIFDDIYTTGSTVNECIKEVSKFTKDIGVLIIAKDYLKERKD